MLLTCTLNKQFKNAINEFMFRETQNFLSFMLHNPGIRHQFIYSDHSYIIPLIVNTCINISFKTRCCYTFSEIFKDYLIRPLHFHNLQISHLKLNFVYMTDTFFNWILFHFPCFFCSSSFQLAFFSSVTWQPSSATSLNCLLRRWLFGSIPSSSVNVTVLTTVSQ